MKITCDFISGAANTVSGCIKWIVHNNLNLIIFGLNNLVAVSDVESTSIICTLKGHLGRVNTLDFIAVNNQLMIFSGSDDSTVKLWIYNTISENYCNWVNLTTITGWNASVLSVSTVLHEDILTVTGVDSKGKIKVWSQTLGDILDFERSITTNKTELFIQVNEIVLPTSQLARNIKTAVYKSSISFKSDLLLFIGSVDSKIHVYVASFEDLLTIVNQQSSMNAHSMRILSSVGSLAGHEEWITSLEIYYGSVDKTVDSSACLTLASSSQDSKIRIWRLTSADVNASASLSFVKSEVKQEQVLDEDDDDELLDAQEDAVVLAQEEILSEARLEFKSENMVWSVYLDALLIGHEDWVTSIHFMRANTQGIVQLFSTSMDRNMIIWGPDHSSGGLGTWIPLTRMGDIGGTLGGSVGQNLLGFIGGTLNVDGDSILGIGYGGSFHLWKQKSDGRWTPELFLTGHFASVNDIVWQPRFGNYLVTVSSDQTSRLFSSIKKSIARNKVVWKEISRPQIHGYDINCAVLNNDPSSQNMLFSGSDEKIIRVFDSPVIVKHGLLELSGVDMMESQDENISWEDRSAQVYRAYIPELGLSTKAADLMSQQELSEQESRGVMAIDWSLQAPLEGQLADHTIWPEVKKLFGHVNEVICMTLSPDNKLLASACKSRDTNAGKIYIWDMKSLICVDQLAGHESTVACLKFSPDSSLLASAGKDRSLIVYYRDTSNHSNLSFSSAQVKKSAHKRIIWDCCWSECSRNDSSTLLITASRDGTCKLWDIQVLEGERLVINNLYSLTPFNGVSVTSIDICSIEVNLEYLLTGSENGDVKLWKVFRQVDSTDNILSFELVGDIPTFYSHASTVKKLKWKPVYEKRELVDAGVSSTLTFASCGEDHTVRVMQITI